MATEAGESSTKKEEVKPKTKFLISFPGVPGLCRDKGYEGCLYAETIQWGIGMGVSSGGGWGRRRRRQKPEEGKEAEVRLYKNFAN